jgi:hypothetical protein
MEHPSVDVLTADTSSLLEEAPGPARPREGVVSPQRRPGHDHRLAW